MDNQHTLIKGYRNLTPAEIELINKIKAHSAVTNALLGEVHQHINTQIRDAANANDKAETARIDDAQPQRWAAMARSDFQIAVMKLVRAVAQPTVF